MFLKSATLLVNNVKLYTKAVAAIIASGNLILSVLRIAAVLNFIRFSNSKTYTSLIKLCKTSRSFASAVFQHNSSTSVIAEIAGCEHVNNLSINSSAECEKWPCR